MKCESTLLQALPSYESNVYNLDQIVFDGLVAVDFRYTIFYLSLIYYILSTNLVSVINSTTKCGCVWHTDNIDSRGTCV